MNPDVKTPTAKIYQFPQRTPKTEPKQPAQVARTIYGNCWYHDEAIQQSEHKPSKPVR